MTEETQDQVEIQEEPKPQKYYFTVRLGLADATVESSEAEPSIAHVLAEAMGIAHKLVYLDEVWVDPGVEYWSRTKILVEFHVGPNTTAHLKAAVHWTRY